MYVSKGLLETRLSGSPGADFIAAKLGGGERVTYHLYPFYKTNKFNGYK
jgi:hypothetical protein